MIMQINQLGSPADVGRKVASVGLSPCDSLKSRVALAMIHMYDVVSDALALVPRDPDMPTLGSGPRG